jgi:hypothetical protein
MSWTDPPPQPTLYMNGTKEARCAKGLLERLVGPRVPVIVDGRALNQRAIQMLGAILAQQDGHHPTATPPLGGRLRPRAGQASPAGSLGGDGEGAVRRRRTVIR